MRRIFLALLTLPVVDAGCGDCAGVGYARLGETERTIAVGESFEASYEEGGSCSGVFRPARAPQWSTPDTAVLSVDILTGVVTGKRAGDAHLFPGTGLTHGAEFILVHVRGTGRVSITPP